MLPQILPGLMDVGGDDRGAIEVVKYLLQAVGRDIVAFQRNTQVSYLVAQRARDIVEAINKCIIDVENNEEDWKSYDKFSVAIEPFEDMLFGLLALTAEEKGQYLAKTSSAVECVSSAKIWADKRNEMFNTLNELYTREELVKLVPDTETRESDHQDAQLHDDKTLLEEMRTQIQDILKDPKEFPTYVNDIKAPLDELQDAVINYDPRVPTWLMVVTIQTSMLIQGVLDIVKVTTDIDTRNHLKSKPVWDTASALINVLDENKTLPDSPKDVNDKYQAFLDILVVPVLGCVLPESYVKLMRKVGHIRRPFQAQAITVVMLCRSLARTFSTVNKSDITIENFDSVEAAFNKTLGVLEGATQAVADLKTFDMSTFKNHDTVKAFGAAEALIKGGFESLNLSTEWTKVQTDLSTAVKRDEDRLKKLQDIFNKGPIDTTKIKVKVTIHETLEDETVLDTTSVDGEESMRLSALRWSIAGALQPEDTKKRAAAGTFYKESADQWLKLTAHSTLKGIANGGSVTLRLVLA